MDVWMVQRINFAMGSVSTSIFSDKFSALKSAGNAMFSHMMSIGLHHYLNAEHTAYLGIHQLIQTGSYSALSKAVDAYDLLTIRIPVEERLYIRVIMTNVIDSAVGTDSTVTATNPVAVQKKVDKPCKQCRRNVSEDEDSCWYCGVKNPGK
jgi:hypothetical protein